MDLTTFRLPESIARSLDEIAERRQVTRSQIVREALEQYCVRARTQDRESRVDVVKGLLGYPGSGVKDLGSRSEHHLRKRLRAKPRRTR